MRLAKKSPTTVFVTNWLGKKEPLITFRNTEGEPDDWRLARDEAERLGRQTELTPAQQEFLDEMRRLGEEEIRRQRETRD